MIKPAATSASSSLALGLGSQAAPTDDTAVSGDFAALLDATRTSGLTTGQDGVTDQAALIEQAIGQQMRQAAGNAAGKKLPLELLDAAALADSATQPTDGSAEDAAATTDAAALTLGEIILPGLVVPVSVPQAAQPAALAPTAPSTALSTVDSLKQNTAAQAVRMPAASQVAIAAAAVALPATNPKAQTQPTVQTAAQPLPPAEGMPAPAAAAMQVVPARTQETALLVANLTAAGTTDPSGARKDVEGIRLGIKPASDKPAPADRPSTLAALTNSQQVTAQTAAEAKPAMPDSTTRDIATATQAKTGTPEAKVAGSLSSEIAKPDTLAIAADTPAAPAAAPTAAITQPMLGVQDGQSLSQAVASVNAAPTAGGIAQTGHDFATLVDRLVEARQAAMPEAVHAAVTHSEFGQVSLRFEQDANGLSVAMSSADPEFAKAVQASSAGSQTASDNGSNAPRQDTSSQQQTAGSASGQPQSQASARGDRNERNSQTQTDSRSGRTSGQQTQDDDATATRGGIYA